MYVGLMFVISSMITFIPMPAYSHATPVAPAGSDVPPPPATVVGYGRVIPRALPTVAAVGQLAAAAAAAIVAVAIGAVVGAGVAAVAGTAVAAVGTVNGVALLEPQALTMTPSTRAVTASRREPLCDM